MCLVLLLILYRIWQGIFDINEWCVNNERFKQSIKLKFPKCDVWPKDEVAQIVPYGLNLWVLLVLDGEAKQICFFYYETNIFVSFIFKMEYICK